MSHWRLSVCHRQQEVLLCAPPTQLAASCRHGSTRPWSNTTRACGCTTWRPSDIDALARHLEQRPCGFGIDEQLPITDHPTLLYVAASNGNTAVVRLLIERRADVNATSCGGWTALHGAASCLQSAQTVAMLLLARPPTCMQQAVWKARHHCTWRQARTAGRRDAAAWLAADPGARDHDGDTPLDIVNRMTQMDPCCGGETADRQFGALSVFRTRATGDSRGPSSGVDTIVGSDGGGDAARYDRRQSRTRRMSSVSYSTVSSRTLTREITMGQAHCMRPLTPAISTPHAHCSTASRSSFTAPHRTARRHCMWRPRKAVSRWCGYWSRVAPT